ncbi:N-formylglutamate deformylase [Lentilitoribacter sp. EG35]|uniref:N-formylglutamate deformylase n=1 Tax=Lentilitoribacter sp. EG35 TaxID=3234192 RepID=UPI00345F4FD3
MINIEITESSSPLILGLPHTGTIVPDDITDKLNPVGRALADTDWHIHNLYDGLADATTVRTPIHRYVIDVNRDPAGKSLYPGQNTTTLCPLTDFDGRTIYKDGFEPDEDEINHRCETYHKPYHTALADQIARVKSKHGFAILYDCHSIRGEIPFLFENRLPDLNIGTNNGTTCDGSVEALVTKECQDSEIFSNILNGRFKGGWTTRHYGKPKTSVHAIQMEIAQANYMIEKAPWTYLPERAEPLRALLSNILISLTNWRPN